MLLLKLEEVFVKNMKKILVFGEKKLLFTA